jgi:hypothetical protein
VATLTYVYADSTAVLGPLATHAEPHSYDLCAEHAERLTAPRGWEVVRLAPELIPTGPTPDDLVALADAVREASRQRSPQPLPAERPTGEALVASAAGLTPDVGRRGHLRVLSSEDD